MASNGLKESMIEQINVKVTDKEKLRILNRAEEYGVSPGELARVAINKFLLELEKTTPMGMLIRHMDREANE